MIRVLPANETMMKVIKHPGARAFVNMTTPIEWPLDQFTIRRLQEGAIVHVGARPPKQIK